MGKLKLIVKGKPIRLKKQAIKLMIPQKLNDLLID